MHTFTKCCFAFVLGGMLTSVLITTASPISTKHHLKIAAQTSGCQTGVAEVKTTFHPDTGEKVKEVFVCRE